MFTSHSKQYDFSSGIEQRFSSRHATIFSTLPWNKNTADNDQSFHSDKHLIFIEQLTAFLAKAKGNTTLQEKPNSAQSPEEVVSITKDSGHKRTAYKLNKLNSGELEHISGGDKQRNTFHPQAWLDS
ncbi:Nif11-like leader peptide family natural product precursor [Synechococcus sp. BIOS-E4-1]|uniref:Nif11-like leader peptide family natural product precursor n=1 Tax=Synechococcus sp. BIOS-E4-1 TaxID=1400864 RepID=UPI0016456CA2|nr:Nif11-like leader peptide family natural product precursor [Synechococcus sp. BIOS-E4-1]